MDLRKIKKLIELLEDSALVEMEITEGENTIRLSRSSSNGVAMAAPVPVAASAPVAAAPAVKDAASSPAAEPAGEVITSPMVGTVYLQAEPGSPAFVSVGDKVSEGQTLLIIEAMKTMNQIPAPHAGTVKRIVVGDGAPVEFGAPLMIIE